MNTNNLSFDKVIGQTKNHYQQYINGLPIAEDFKPYLLDDEFFEKNPSMYLIYPTLFEEKFSIFSDEKLTLLCVAGYLYYRSVIENDATLDNDELLSKNQMFTVVSSIAQEESIKILSHLFGLDSTFWKYWNLRKGEYMKGLRMDKKYATFARSTNDLINLENYEKKSFDTEISIEEYEKIADYKSAFGKVAIDATYLLSGQNDKEAHQQMLASHALFSVGFQLMDDIHDLKKDIRNSQLNYAIQCLRNYCLDNQIDFQNRDPEQLHKFLYISGVASSLLELAISYFDRALACIEPYGLVLWKKVIEDKNAEAQKILKEVNVYNKLVDLRVELRHSKQKHPNLDFTFHKNTTLWHKIANDALKNLLDEWQKDFGEVKHIMYLSKAEGFASDNEYHIGDVFQRALIAESLAEVNPFFDNQLNFVLENEVNYLLSKRIEHGVGGWNYFPSVPEIAPDADDLGQIIQVFVKSNHLNIGKEHFETPIRVLLSDNYRSNGGFETWIVPKNDQSLLQQLQNLFNETKWGKGPDTEVVANMLHGLQLLDESAYKQQITASCEYLMNQQEVAGFWKSRWYYGPFYGTYVTIRALHHAGLGEKNIQKAIDFIIDSQKSNGGWGFIDDKSDPLSTALAMLSLCFEKNNDKVKNALQSGLNYIQGVQKADGTWAAIKFIAPKMNEPYSSTTLSSSFILKAVVNAYSKLFS